MSLDDAYDFFKEGQEEAVAWFQAETKGLRAGRVKPDLVENIVVEHYGARTPLKGVASISSSDARTLLISPWDPSALPAIKKAVVEAQLGVQPTVDGKIVRLSFPSLTEENRQETIRLLHKRAEEARVRLRRRRDEALNMIKKEKQASTITEDDFYEGKEHLDELIDAANTNISDLIAAKEKDIRTI